MRAERNLFEDITAKNVGRRLAIVLDDTVYSAPRIQERIGGGRAVITGSFDIREARDLTIVLRAGALPAPVTIAEERTVGPPSAVTRSSRDALVRGRRRLGRRVHGDLLPRAPACSRTPRC